MFAAHRILNKTLDYLDAFARFKQKENVEAVERLLSARKDLTKFERAQIGASGPPSLPNRGARVDGGNHCQVFC